MPPPNHIALPAGSDERTNGRWSLRKSMVFIGGASLGLWVAVALLWAHLT